MTIHRNILIGIFLILSSNLALAEDQTYGAIIEKQAEQIKNLKTRLESLENRFQGLSDIVAKSKKETTNIKIADHTDQAKEEAPDPAKASSNIDPTQDRPDYELALATLKESKFEEAEEKFSAFITNYPNSKFQANAIFWYAETFYLRSMFNPAAMNYLKSYKKAPQGLKASDALLKLALSLGSLNKKQEACNMLGKLDAEFPTRSEASMQRTKEAKANLKCK